MMVLWKDLKHNSDSKALRDSVHPGKLQREKLKGAAFDLFEYEVSQRKREFLPAIGPTGLAIIATRVQTTWTTQCYKLLSDC